MSNPLISIITVCYNSEKTIRNTLDSVLNQSYDNYEYIIVDGMSTDSTLQIIDEYKERFKEKLVFISEKDNGIYDAMNKGIKLAKGSIIGIINSDDWYEENAFEKIRSNFNSSEMQVIYGMQRLIKNENEFEVVIKNHEFIEERMITHPTCFISKRIYEKYGMYNLDYKISADYEFMLRIRDKKDITYTKVYDIIANFRVGGASSTENGLRETAKIKYIYNLLGRKQYNSIIFKSKLYCMLKR